MSDLNPLQLGGAGDAGAHRGSFLLAVILVIIFFRSALVGIFDLADPSSCVYVHFRL